jgi:hypothetical protein
MRATSLVLILLSLTHVGVSAADDRFSPWPHGGRVADWEFRVPDRWTRVDEKGQWRLAVTASSPTAAREGLGTYALLKGNEVGDFTLDFTARSLAANDNDAADLAVVFAYRDGDNYCYLLMNSHPEYSRLYRVESGQRHGMARTQRPAITDRKDHRFCVQRKDKTIRAWRDGVLLLETEDDALSHKGRLGVGAFNDPVSFDDIRVRDAAVPEAELDPAPSLERLTDALGAAPANPWPRKEQLEDHDDWRVRDWGNPGRGERMVHQDSNRVLVIGALGDEREKLALTRDMQCDLSGRVLAVSIYNPSSEPVPVAAIVCIGEDWVYHESPQEILFPRAWNRLVFTPTQPMWKCAASDWLYTKAVPSLDQARQIGLLVYNGDEDRELLLDQVFIAEPDKVRPAVVETPSPKAPARTSTEPEPPEPEQVPQATVANRRPEAVRPPEAPQATEAAELPPDPARADETEADSEAPSGGLSITVAPEPEQPEVDTEDRNGKRLLLLTRQAGPLAFGLFVLVAVAVTFRVLSRPLPDDGARR